MSKKIKIQTFKIILTIVVILFSYFWLKIYDESLPLNINIAKVEEQVTSNKLLASFESNENLAYSNYVEKVVVVEGVVKDVTYLNNRFTVILQNQNGVPQILCDMLFSEKENVKELKTGQKVNIKGVCKGYLLDVIMLNCILVNK